MSDLKPCPHCGEEPIEHATEAHKHYLVNLPDYPGSFVIECVCGAGSIGDTRDEAKAKWNRRAQPAQAGQALTDEEIDAAYEKARADYQRSRFAVRGQQLTAQDSPDWWFARAVEAAVLAKRVPMTEAQINAALSGNPRLDNEESFALGVRAAEQFHGIVGKEGA